MILHPKGKRAYLNGGLIAAVICGLIRLICVPCSPATGGVFGKCRLKVSDGILSCGGSGFADGQDKQGCRAGEYGIGVPHPAVVTELCNHDAADVRAEESADLVGKHHQSEQGGEVARAEEFAGNGGGRGDGGEPCESECGGENVKVEVGFG